MGRVRAWGAFITIAGSLAIACNALTGVGDLEANGLDDAGSGLIVSDSAVDATPIVGLDGQVPTDSGKSSSSSGTDASSSSSGSLTCAGVGGTCTPKAPEGWEGPYRVIDEKVTADAECPEELSTDVFELAVGTPTGTFTCPACSCKSPAGGACTSTFSLWADDTTCSSGGAVPQVNDATVCQQNTAGVSVGAKFHHTVTASGKCDPVLNGQPQRGNIDWTTTYLFCGSSSLSAIGCTSTDDRCLSPAKGGKICIIKEGTAACPAPWTASTTIYGDVDDQRTCAVTGCSCADPSGVGCSAQYKTFSTPACTNPLFPLPIAHTVDVCFTLENAFSGKATVAPTASGGSCAPAGNATAAGGLVPKDPGTTCCLP